MVVSIGVNWWGGGRIIKCPSPIQFVLHANNSVYRVEVCQIKNWISCGGKLLNVYEGLVETNLSTVIVLFT